MHRTAALAGLLLLLCPLSAAGGAVWSPRAQKVDPLNVVLILIDDMSHGDIAAHGNPVLSQRTLLIAMNDNGGTQGVGVHNSGMRGEKGSAWRGGMRERGGVLQEELGACKIWYR